MNKTGPGRPEDDGIPTLTQVLAPGDAPAGGELALRQDMAVLAERLAARLSGQLAGEIGALVETRCRDALLDHMNWLVQTITRQVTDDVQRQLGERVRTVVIEELARHT